MRLHCGPAVLHCVMFKVVFFWGWGVGENLEYGLYNRAGKSFNHLMSHGKNLFHKTSVIFTE